STFGKRYQRCPSSGSILQRWKVSHLVTNTISSRHASQLHTHIKVFDFQHNTPENQEWVLPYNSFELVVGALRATNGIILIPGDSTSMISEAIDMLPLGKVIVYETHAMNEIHKAHIISELALGRISILENYQHIKAPALNSGISNSSALPPPAAMTIAQKIWGELMEENKP
nr:hypothetical protein [Alphaproteobacteria bacterium]